MLSTCFFWVSGKDHTDITGARVGAGVFIPHVVHKLVSGKAALPMEEDPAGAAEPLCPLLQGTSLSGE